MKQPESSWKPLFADESREKCPYSGCGSLQFEQGTYRCYHCKSWFYLDERTLEESYNDEQV
jgi:hypothetical protein